MWLCFCSAYFSCCGYVICIHTRVWWLKVIINVLNDVEGFRHTRTHHCRMIFPDAQVSALISNQKEKLSYHTSKMHNGNYNVYIPLLSLGSIQTSLACCEKYKVRLQFLRFINHTHETTRRGFIRVCYWNLISLFCSWFSVYFDFLIYYTDAIKHLPSCSVRRHVYGLMSSCRVHNYIAAYIFIEAISICVHTLIADPSCKLFPLLFWNVCFFSTSKACLAVFDTRYSSVIYINASSKS